jgi:hypothetical protein
MEGGMKQRARVQDSALEAAASAHWPLGFEPFVQGAPLTVMVRTALDWLVAQGRFEQLFDQVAERQYVRELTLSALVELMLEVACGIQPSAHAAYRAHQAQLCVSYQALYAKLSRTEPALAAAVVARSAELISRYISSRGLSAPEPIAGYRARIVDGTVLAGHDHRLAPLRDKRSAGLTGLALAVFAPAQGLVSQVVLAEDAYTQERALIESLAIEAGEVWLADRNFCTRGLLSRLDRAGAGFLIRWHASALPFEALGPLTRAGAAQEQPIRVALPEEGAPALRLRRIVLPLEKPTRSGDTELILVTNLPAAHTAERLAQAYRERWRIETHYQRLSELLHCELPGLGYPRAALFAFAMAVTAANALALVLAALRAVHGHSAVEALSYFRLVDHIAHTWQGMMIALPPQRWEFVQPLSAQALGQWLEAVATAVPIARFARRKPSRAHTPPRKTARDTRPHHSVKRLLDQQRDRTC